jgi:flavin reductase (DIM6/NTAB) family NADH-FMN oxidoreductase RutF/AcrR family transcriptional regulator
MAWSADGRLTPMTTTQAAFDSRRFRHVLGHFATGVAVITADTPAGPVGMAVSSFTSVSLEPPLVAFLPDKSSTSWPRIRDARAFCVNILSAGQEELCAKFARTGTDKFAGVAWRPATSGAPILDGGMAWLDCELTQTFESGDHYIAIGRVLQLEAVEYAVPLVFFQGGYGHFTGPRPPAGGVDHDGPMPGRSGTGGGGVLASASATDRFSELARMTGMDARDLKRYAESAEGVVNELVGGYVRAFHDECREISLHPVTAAEALSELLRAAFGSMEDNRVPIMILHNERQFLATRPEFGYLEQLERAIDQVWLTTLQRGVDEGDFRPDLNVAITYRFIGDMLFAAARRYRPDGSGHPGADIVQLDSTCRSLILHGLLR